jgi:hypothetical protein
MLERLIFITLVVSAVLIVTTLTVVLVMRPGLTPWGGHIPQSSSARA